MKREDRRCRKSRQHDHRLVADRRKAKRLAGLERYAMHQNPGTAEPRYDAMRQIADAFRCAAAEHSHVARFEPTAHRAFESSLIVWQRAERHRLTACFDHGRGDDGAVTVVNAAGAKRLARLHELVAG